MVKVILVRHGYSETNRDKRFTGQMDVPLDERGILQGQMASEYIYNNYKVDKIYSSDLSRAVETVRLLAEKLSLPIETKSAFRELNMGTWEGMYIDDVKKLESYMPYCDNPVINPCDGGENYTMLIDRVYSEFVKVVEENDGKTIVIASHGGTIKVLNHFLKTKSLDNIKDARALANASITVVNYEDGKYSFELEGYDDYLELKTGCVNSGIVH